MIFFSNFLLVMLMRLNTENLTLGKILGLVGTMVLPTQFLKTKSPYLNMTRLWITAIHQLQFVSQVLLGNRTVRTLAWIRISSENNILSDNKRNSRVVMQSFPTITQPGVVL